MAQVLLGVGGTTTVGLKAVHQYFSLIRKYECISHDENFEQPLPPFKKEIPVAFLLLREIELILLRIISVVL